MTGQGIHDFSAQAIDGREVAFADWRGKVLLVVNTASECGFTPQFAGLQQLWLDYRDRGLVVVGFPSNQFGHQDPGSDGEIAAFCERSFGVDFPMMAKVEVNGARRIRCGAGSPRRRRACSARAPSSGTSPSSWSAATAARSRRFAPTERPESLRRPIEAALAAA